VDKKTYLFTTGIKVLTVDSGGEGFFS